MYMQIMFYLSLQLESTRMCVVLNLKQRMIELVRRKLAKLLAPDAACMFSVLYRVCVFIQTGRNIPPLLEAERTAKVYTGEGNFKVTIILVVNNECCNATKCVQQAMH